MNNDKPRINWNARKMQIKDAEVRHDGNFNEQTSKSVKGNDAKGAHVLDISKRSNACHFLTLLPQRWVRYTYKKIKKSRTWPRVGTIWLSVDFSGPKSWFFGFLAKCLEYWCDTLHSFLTNATKTLEMRSKTLKYFNSLIKSTNHTNIY